MAYTTIDDPSAYLHTQLYSGTGSALSVTNDANAGDFQPDLIWLKSRTSANNHNIFDSSRGQTKRLYPNLTDAEDTVSGFTLNTNGFSTGTSSIGDINISGESHVAWQWKCNGGTTETAVNESGDNPANVRQTNTTAGFSIITSTGTGNTGTIAHGLGAVPEIIISKQRSNAENWAIYHGSNTSAPETEILTLNTTDATADNANAYNDTAPTSSVFTVHTKNEVNTDARTYVHYVWTPIQGFSKFGSYEGNGNADGTFVYTGFKPALVITKPIDQTGNWNINDSTRSPDNVVDERIKINSSAAETDSDAIDFLSNGFKIRTSGTSYNQNANTYIYMAFAEQPFVSSKGVPCTAR
jgi:hypothetical protein